jgi:hypothetical protein
MTRGEPRIPRAFAGAEIGDRQNRVCPGGFVRPVSNADFPISGIARRERARPVCFSLRPFAFERRNADATLGRSRFRCLARPEWEPDQTMPNCSSCSVQDSGRLRASRVTVRSAGAQPSAIASMTRGDR